MPTLDEVEKLRKTIESVSKQIVRLTEKRNATVRELTDIEDRCPHKWTSPTLVKGTKGAYEKTCVVCGKRLVSRDVTVKF